MKRTMIATCIVSALACVVHPPAPTPTPTPAPSAAATTPQLTSGFEDDVVVQPPKVESGDWVQYITGADQGYDWARDLPQRSFPRNRVNYLVPSASQLSRYAEAAIDTLPDRNGVSTRALFMSLKKQVTTGGTGVRVQYGIYPPAETVQGYVSYWLKLQPNLATEILPRGKRVSRQIMELKETGATRADFRWSILIQREPGRDALFWRVQAQYGDLTSSPTAWSCESTSAQVPVDQWFQLEVYWKSGLLDGRMWGAANGVAFVDYAGRTRADSPVYVWWPFKVYVGTAFVAKPIYQWVDDVLFDDEPPTGTPATPSGVGYTCKTGA